MAKVDTQSACRIIPVSLLDRPLLGFQWKGKFFMDAVLPMGVYSACTIFESFSTKWNSVAFRKYIRIAQQVRSWWGGHRFVDDFVAK